MDLLLEYWTAYYAALAAKGTAISFDEEDEDYDLDRILAELDDRAGDADADSNDWETVFEDHSP